MKTFFEIYNHDIFDILFPGGFEEVEASEGSVACLNIWDEVFTSETLLNFSRCENHGNIFHLSDTSGTLYGDVFSEFSSEDTTRQCNVNQTTKTY